MMAALLCCACAKDLLSLSDNNLEFASFGGEVEVAVTANIQWEATCETGWLSVETSGNTGNGTITVKVPPHYSAVERSAKITVTTPFGGLIQEIGIVQKGDNPSQFYIGNGDPSKGNVDLVGSAKEVYKPHDPRIGPYDDYILYPESPLRIYGKIKDGIVDIDFTNEQFESAFGYESFGDGYTFLHVVIVPQDNSRQSISLHKVDEKYFGQLDLYSVVIFYVHEDFSELKSGWNFVELCHNHDPLPGEKDTTIGIISKDINVFLEKGYRWQFDRTFL